MTEKEKLKLIEYRYSKMCRLECDVSNSFNLLFRYMDNKNTLTSHFYNVVYFECFKSVMADVFDLLNVYGGNKNG
jgi:hypothetical protein